MLNNDMVEIFHDCVTRLENGATIDDCLQSYPQVAEQLHPMLEAIQIPKRAQVSNNEVTESQVRVMSQFEQALNQPMQVRFRPVWSRVASIVLLMLFMGSLLTTGVVLVAQDSIPGDRLYGVKRWSEQVRLSIANDDTNLRQEFAQRRIDETRQVVQRQRQVRVEFAGVIEGIKDTSLTIAGLQVELSPRLRTIELIVGLRLDVVAQTQADGTILATEIRVLDLPEPINTQDVRPTPTPIQLTRTLPAMTVTVQTTPTTTPTPTPEPAREETTVQPTDRPTDSSTDTPTLRATATLTEMPESDNCILVAPDGWVDYTIQAGDTPSGIAVGTSLSLDELYSVNCHIDPRVIVAGEVIYVPYEPRLAVTDEPTVTSERMREEMEATAVERPINPTQQTRPTATDVPSRDNDREREKQRQRENNEENDDGNSGRGR